MRKISFDAATGFKKGDGIIIMFFNPRRDGKNIGIENDIFRREIHFIDKQIIGPLTDAEFIISRLSLAFFVKGHDNRGCA